MGAQGVWWRKDAACAKRSYMATGYCGARKKNRAKTITSFWMCNYNFTCFFRFFSSLSLFPCHCDTIVTSTTYSCITSEYWYIHGISPIQSYSKKILLLLFNIAIDGLSRFQSLFAVERMKPTNIHCLLAPNELQSSDQCVFAATFFFWFPRKIPS